MGMLATPKAEARRRGRFAAGAWIGTGVLALVGLPPTLVVIGGVGSGWLTWRWLRYRGKWGLRF
ncbi:MAG: hypothetical protein ACQEXJ_15360 [Myxococcota bacterium]